MVLKEVSVEALHFQSYMWSQLSIISVVKVGTCHSTNRVFRCSVQCLAVFSYFLSILLAASIGNCFSRILFSLWACFTLLSQSGSLWVTVVSTSLLVLLHASIRSSVTIPGSPSTEDPSSMVSTSTKFVLLIDFMASEIPADISSVVRINFLSSYPCFEIKFVVDWRFEHLPQGFCRLDETNQV